MSNIRTNKVIKQTDKNNDNYLSPAQRNYIQHEQKKKRSILIWQILIFFLLIFAWEVLADTHIINSFIFSSPSKIAICFYDMMIHNGLLHHILITLFETMISFFFVILLSLLLAILLWWNQKLSKILEPYMVVLNSLPKSALAPILIVWLGANIRTIIVCGISVAIFGSILTIYTGFATVEADQLRLITTLKGNRYHQLKYVVIPSNIPTILSIAKVNIGLSLVGVIIGEFLASKAGLGYLIIYGSQTFKLTWVLMSIFLLCIMAFVLYEILSLIENKVSDHF